MRPCPGRFTNPVSRKGHVSTQNVPQSFKLLSAHKKKNKHDLVFVLPFHTRSKWVFFSCSGYGGRLGGEDRGGWLQWERQKASRDGYHKARCCTASCPGDDDVRDVHYATGPLVACGHWSICALRGAALFLGLTQHGSSSQPVACGCGEELSHHGICWLRNPTETK